MSILLLSPKNVYITQRLLDEAAKANIHIENFSMQELVDCDFKVDVSAYDTLYIRSPFVNGSPKYFPQIISLAKQFRHAGKKVVDAAIAQGDVGPGKMPVYEKLAAANIPIPKTGWLRQAKEWQYPCIVKWTFGFGGKEVFLVKNADDLKKATELLPMQELILQEFIEAEYEYKVITVGYKSIPVILRFEINKENWRPDFGKTEVLTLGSHPGIFEGSQKYPGSSTRPISGSRLSPIRYDSGRLEPVETADALGRDGAEQLVSLAEQSSRLLNRELAKVDILESKGKFYVLEVNRWPGLDTFEKLTGYNVVGEFVKYLVK